MNKYTVSALIAIVAVVAGLMALGHYGLGNDSQARSLQTNMKQIQRSYKAALKAEDLQTLLGSLNEMKAAAAEARTQTPRSIYGEAADSEDMRDYTAGMDRLLKQIDEAVDLASQGRLSELPALFDDMDAVKEEFHERFESMIQS